jgi:hypothetical protein
VNEIILPRRKFLQCLTGLIAAPAVVKADNMMRIQAPKIITAPIYPLYRRQIFENPFNAEKLMRAYAERISATHMLKDFNPRLDAGSLVPMWGS